MNHRILRLRRSPRPVFTICLALAGIAIGGCNDAVVASSNSSPATATARTDLAAHLVAVAHLSRPL